MSSHVRDDSLDLANRTAAHQFARFSHNGVRSLVCADLYDSFIFPNGSDHFLLTANRQA